MMKRKLITQITGLTRSAKKTKTLKIVQKKTNQNSKTNKVIALNFTHTLKRIYVMNRVWKF